MAITIKRRRGENVTTFLNRASKIINRSGVLIETRKKKFYHSKPNKRSKKISALHRIKVKKDIEIKRRKGLL
ncbi:MAG: 30S ribosomal protein S21 [Candidatus Paceibacterota bacterium]|jgi:ribosomal protein S21